MEFSGSFEIEGADPETVWLALSDPVMIREELPGCQFLVEVEDGDPDFDELRERAGDGGEDTLPDADPETVSERAFQEGATYAALMEISVGSVSPSFESVVTVDERDYPEMSASGEGSAGNSSFEMNAGMTLEETDDGVAVDWRAEADVFGRIAQMGQRVIDPVANRVVSNFFENIEERLGEVQAEESGLRDKVQDLL